MGSEPTPGEFVAAMVAVFREVRRVLRADGTLWMNMGDSYAGGNKGGNYNAETWKPLSEHVSGWSNRQQRTNNHDTVVNGLKPKDLCGIPWRLAFALQDDGWWLRSDIIWHKCLSGGAVVYAKTQKGEMPMTVKDMTRLDPATVQLWDGEKWNQVIEWQSVLPDPDRKQKSEKMRQQRRRGYEAIPQGDLEIELRNGERISCTRNHKWPTPHGLVQADELKVGNVILSTSLPEPKELRTPELLPDEVGWFVGLYIAEGNQSQGTIQIASHIRETSRYERLCAIAAQFDGYCFKAQTSENGMSIMINSPVLCGVLEAYVSGTDAYTKHLNVRCWKRSNSFLAAVIQGWLDGDAHRMPSDQWRIAFTNNDALASDLRTICARLGYSLRLRRRKATMNGREFPCWRGDLYMDTARRRAVDTEVVAIRQSRARQFWMISLAEQPHLFALASGTLTGNSNPMPESVTDRPTKSHEYVFLLTKSARYYYDQEAVREAGNGTWNNRGFRNGGEGKYIHDSTINNSEIPERQYSDKITMPSTSRNLRDVWTIPTYAYSEAHFATYPPALVEPCVKAGTSEKGCCPRCGKPWERVVEKEQYSDSPNSYPVGDRRGKCPSSSRMNVNGAQPQQSHVMSITTTTGWRPGCECDAGEPVACTVLDPFGGAGTTGLVADRLGRHAILIELNADYAAMAERRIREDNPMFTQVRVR
jgi:DNA modification methylase